jgi:hypothetical protein
MKLERACTCVVKQRSILCCEHCVLSCIVFSTKNRCLCKRFVWVCRFYYAKAGAEVHKCGPSNSADSYDSLCWVNTSAVESVNSFLKGFRSLGWYSGLESFMVILPLLLDAYKAGLKWVDDAKLGVEIAASMWSIAVCAVLLRG